MTSDERREVAERLRGEEIARNSEEAYVVLLSCIGIRPQLPAVRTYKDAMARLADLIDPTCNFVESPDNDDFSIRVVFGYICHDCGHETIVESTAGGWAEPPHYCSNCGARLVSDDD